MFLTPYNWSLFLFNLNFITFNTYKVRQTPLTENEAGNCVSNVASAVGN